MAGHIAEKKEKEKKKSEAQFMESLAVSGSWLFPDRRVLCHGLPTADITQLVTLQHINTQASRHAVDQVQSTADTRTSGFFTTPLSIRVILAWAPTLRITVDTL